jgi:hypothetical protein
MIAKNRPRPLPPKAFLKRKLIKLPLSWSSFWGERNVFPRLVDLAVAEDQYTFEDNGVTFVALTEENSRRFPTKRK